MGTKWNLVFPGGKRNALTFSYDDGLIFDRQLVQLFNQYQVKGTFNLNSGEFGRVAVDYQNGVEVEDSTIKSEEVATLYEEHEVASHTVSHPSLTNMDTSTMAYEVINDRKNLEDLTHQFVTGFAYPYGTYNNEVEQVLKMCGIEYARTVQSTHGFDLPANPLEWNPTCHHNDEQLMELAKEFCEKKDPYGRIRVFYVWGHSFEFGRNNDWYKMENLLAYMKPYFPDIWLATNHEIMDYYLAFKQAKYTADGNKIRNTSGIDLYFSGEEGIFCVKAFSEKEL
ncbi:polysaccharide deacetylase family protein [Anaerosporobacter faecicola]|uniref:polysaccharide deacetylase family protein n=1 Tax=Anaerosporobacter faecicola TaxID=2718714 RepID=UPI00143B423E|nr:polysaccharide deacetylase family protein [Anaerosporobacter faecicola]